MDLTQRRFSAALLAGVFVLCVYRAATQSFTIDESFTFLHYVDVPLDKAFAEYSANNHILHTLLMRFFRWALGKSEIVLRIPALFGTLLFLTASYRITDLVVKGRWWPPIALSLIVLNPLVLDLLVAARGYSLALGLSWWSMVLVCQDLHARQSSRLWLAGVTAGLAIASNLIFLIPLAALGLLLLPLYARERRIWDLIDEYAGPSVVIAFLFAIIPLSKGAGQFYFGVSTLRESAATLLGESVGIVTNRLPALEAFLLDHLIPLLFAVFALALPWLLARAWRRRRPETTVLALATGVTVLSVGCWVLMQRLLGTPLPMTRTAIYILPLIGLTLALAAALATRYVSAALRVSAVLVALLYAAGLRTTYFNEWKSESAMNRLVRRLAQDAGPRPSGAVTAGGSWELEYSTRYYRARYQLHWLNVLSAAEAKSTVPDYYLLTRDDHKLVDQLHLRVIEKDDASGTLLARRS